MYVQSHLICIQSHLIYIQSSYLHSVTLFIFSHHIYFQTPYLCSVSSYLYSVTCYEYSVSFYFAFSQIIYVFSLILYIFSQLFSEAATIERDSNTGVFLWILRNFWNIYSEEHGWAAASVFCILLIPCGSSLFRGNIALSVIVEGNDNNKSPLSNIMATCYIYIFLIPQHNSACILLRYGSTSSMAMFVLQRSLQKNN